MIKIDTMESHSEPQVYIAVGLTEFDTFIVRTGSGEHEAREALDKVHFSYREKKVFRVHASS